MELFIHHRIVFLVPWIILIVIACAYRILTIIKVVDDRLASIIGISCLVFPIFYAPTTFLIIWSHTNDVMEIVGVLSTLASMKVASWIYDRRKRGKGDASGQVC